MRLDKYLCDTLGLTRSEVKKIVSKGRVTVNNAITKRPDIKVNEGTDEVTFDGKAVIYERFVYYMLNKPTGLVCANKDPRDPVVMDLFKDEPGKGLSCVGRLDKDTTGLLFVTNDGDLVHSLTSPGRHVFKDYLVTIAHPISEGDIKALTEGVDIGDDKPTLPAKVKVMDDDHIVLSISEGRFHQVKRMLIAVNNEVLALKRLSLGSVVLDESLKPGEFRRLTAEELTELKSY